MDPITEGIIAGLLTEALLGLFTAAGREASSKSTPRTDLRSLLQPAATALARALPAANPAQRERCVQFLNSREVETLLRKLYLGNLSGREGDSLAPIEREFAAQYGFVLDAPDTADEALALFRLLVDACEQSLQLATERGMLAALDARAVLRDRRLQSRLDAIEQNIAFLHTAAPPDAATVERFVTDYLPQVRNRFGYIIPQSFDRQRKLPIDALYVPPRLIPEGPRIESRGQEPQSMPEVIAAIDRTVLLGNPGGGKSTFAHKLVHLLASLPGEPHIGGRRLLPLFVTLRDYADAKARTHCSLLDFIAERINSDLQLPVPRGVLEYLLRAGRALVVFDGLDELLDTHRRREVSADVESFGTRYPDCAVLISSREVGYDQAPLDGKVFQVWHIAPFDKDQSRDYVTKWFRAEPDLTPDEGRRLTESFLIEAGQTPDLLENPLMLALLCTLYRGAGYLPRNRPATYAKCAELMFERWDRQRGIRVALPYQSHLFYAMQYLAHWVYTEEGLTSGVCEQQLVTRAADYLADYCAENRVEAEAAARDFIAFCRGRAWVFSDAGTRADGERLYAFTHRTFLEYFTASHLARNCKSAEDLADTLLPRVWEGQWDLVAQLACHIKDQTQAGSADIILGRFIAVAGHPDSFGHGFRLYGFMIRCLAFLVPRPGIRREIATGLLDYWIGHRVRASEQSATQGSSDAAPRVKVILEKTTDGGDCYLDLFMSATENLQTVVLAVTERLGELMSPEAAPDTAHAAAEVAMISYMRDLGASRANRNPETPECADWHSFITTHKRRLLQLAGETPWFGRIAAECFPEWSWPEMIDTHGLCSILSRYQSALFREVGLRPPPIAWFLESQDDGWHKVWQRVTDQLMSMPTPWIDSGCQIDVEAMTSVLQEQRRPHGVEIRAHQLFLAFVFGALCVEYLAAQLRGHDLSIMMPHVRPWLDMLAGAPHPAIQPVWKILLTRIDSGFGTSPPLSRHSLEALKMPANQIDFIASWQERKIDLIATPKAKS